ncbi:MAG: hypothetical protein SLAVMIC_00418 [uncultured marine phage]|uniref:Uncharacterized protein n=1 Tax=uncultured marine phage TaxID=707152 RepID=A0A8D9FR20_9VIRU|nr:MAG: hypothetical protein SLAVMIC_00418 [uncultured marine phage]
MKQSLIDQIKKIVDEKKDRLGVTTLHFEEEDISHLDGTLRIGYYIQSKKDSGISNFTFWDEIPAMTLVKIKDKLIKNRFYAEKRLQGASVKVRLKPDK